MFAIKGCQNTFSLPIAIPGSRRPDAAMVIAGKGRIWRKWLNLYQEKMCFDTDFYNGNLWEDRNVQMWSFVSSRVTGPILSFGKY